MEERLTEVQQLDPVKTSVKSGLSLLEQQKVINFLNKLISTEVYEPIGVEDWSRSIN